MGTFYAVMFRSLIVVVALLLVFAAILFFVQDGMIYFPRPYEAGDRKQFKADGLVELEFKTGQGKQVALYEAPSSGAAPRSIWLVFSGNGGRAADYRDLASDADCGYLYIDYPGYGLCEGRPNPKRIDASVDEALVTLAAHLSLTDEELKSRLSVAGHSLGAAVGLRAAGRHEIDQVVVLSPFTSMKAMAASMVGKSYSNVLRHRFDNVAALEHLKAVNPDARVTILSGMADREVPHVMSRELAERFPEMIELKPLNGVGHNDILDLSLIEILEAMKPLALSKN